MEYQILPRGWHDATRRPRRALDTAWFEYLGHLGFTPQHLFEPVTIDNQHFTPTLWLPEWRAFIYVLPQHAPRDKHVAAITTQARQLVEHLPQQDAFVIFGPPDELDTYIEIHSLRSDVLHAGVNRWTIGGNIDKAVGIAYFWMLFSADGRAYIPNTQECFPACYCKIATCEMCSRIESFLPIEVYGEPFRVTNSAHRVSIYRASQGRIAERHRHPRRTHG